MCPPPLWRHFLFSSGRAGSLPPPPFSTFWRLLLCLAVSRVTSRAGRRLLAPIPQRGKSPPPPALPLFCGIDWNQTMSTPPLAGAGMPPGAFSGPQAQGTREVNTASLCRIGQETVQDIVFRTMEIFQLLRNMQLPNGVTYHTGTYQDRLSKLQEHLRQLSILFRKLRLVYDKCNENCAGLDPVLIEQLIPYVEEDGSKHDDRGVASQLRFATEERREIMEVNKKLKQKNQQLKQIMDQLRNLIWDINAMLAMRN